MTPVDSSQVAASMSGTIRMLWSSWASPEHHDRWLAGPAHEQMLREIRRAGRRAADGPLTSHERVPARRG